ncbi:MAG: hypothetical protein HRU72_04000 [Planctomycetia bacterium]|nr:MAG: hypothetical protein HRU72_04000 [Planctomycetia bacterium]
MADVHYRKTTCLCATHRQRSYNLPMIRSKDTKPEIIVRKIFFDTKKRS